MCNGRRETSNNNNVQGLVIIMYKAICSDMYHLMANTCIARCSCRQGLHLFCIINHRITGKFPINYCENARIISIIAYNRKHHFWKTEFFSQKNHRPLVFFFFFSWSFGSPLVFSPILTFGTRHIDS